MMETNFQSQKLLFIILQLEREESSKYQYE